MPITIKDADLLKFTYIRDFILRDVRAHYTLPQLSARIEMNEFKLKKGFKQLYGKSVYDFLQSHRMELGLKLLTSTDKSIKEIASRCGYGHSTNFIAVFRKYYNTKPTHYRRTQPRSRDSSQGAPYTAYVDKQMLTLYQYPGQAVTLQKVADVVY
jgi:AraC family transcriptional activator of pyochelin receptor